MKKTIIAILALSGVALAEEVTKDLTWTSGSGFNSNWAQTLKDSGYKAGADYALTLVVTGGLTGSGVNAYIMQLTNEADANRYLVNQSSSYFGINTRTATQGKNDMPSNWQSTFSYAKDGDTTTLTQSSEGTDLCAWTMASASGSGSRAWGNELTLTISYTQEQGTVVQYTYGGTTAVDKFVMPKTSLDLNDFSVKSDIVLNGAGTLSVTVPEPATATLSLLALAGLAARRRRH